MKEELVALPGHKTIHQESFLSLPSGLSTLISLCSLLNEFSPVSGLSVLTDSTK